MEDKSQKHFSRTQFSLVQLNTKPISRPNLHLTYVLGQELVSKVLFKLIPALIAITITHTNKNLILISLSIRGDIACFSPSYKSQDKLPTSICRLKDFYLIESTLSVTQRILSKCSYLKLNFLIRISKSNLYSSRAMGYFTYAVFLKQPQ